MTNEKKIARIPLKEYSRFHFGELKMDDNLALSSTSLFAHSDTLFSALVHAYAKHYGNASNFVDEFQNGNIKISSLFYYIKGNDQYVYFLPKPVIIDIQSPKDGKHKERNRVKFVSLRVWENGFEAKKWPFKNQGYKIINKHFVLTDEEYQLLGIKGDLVICNNILSPKNPIRAHKNAAIFYQADIEIGSNPEIEIGWYFIFESTSNRNDEKLKLATNIMAYSGIGGEIHNTGRTINTPPEYDFLDIKAPENANPYFTNLSLFCPQNEYDFKQTISYTTTLRGGRKLAVGGNAMVIRMIAEGALFSNVVKGKIESLGEDRNGYPILRNGIPILIPFHYES